MKTRIVHTKIHFEDEWFNTLPIGYRYLFIYLFTNSHIGQTGAYQLSKRVALLESGATEQEWEDACKCFEKGNKVKFIEDWVVIVNAKKYSDYSGNLNKVAYDREFEALPKEIRDTVSIHYIYPIDTTRNKKSEIINNKSEIKDKKRTEEIIKSIKAKFPIKTVK